MLKSVSDRLTLITKYLVSYGSTKNLELSRSRGEILINKQQISYKDYRKWENRIQTIFVNIFFFGKYALNNRFHFFFFSIIMSA